MADTGAPHFIPYVEPTDLVREYPAADEASAFAIAAGLTAAGNAGIGSNVVQAYKNDTFSTTNSTYQDVTGLEATITPSSDTAKILVIGSIGLGSSDSSTADNARARLVRGSTAIANTTNNWMVLLFSNNVSHDVLQYSFAFLDSPASAAATTYKWQVLATAFGGTRTTFVNRNRGVSDVLTTSHLTLIEVAP